MAPWQRLDRGHVATGRSVGVVYAGTVGSLGALWTALLLACGSQAAGQKGGRHPKVDPKDTRIVHEECQVGDDDALKEDINGDGKPDRITVSDGSRPACRALDFNFDGSMDSWVYLDAQGQIRRRESDFDRDGRVDEVALYKAGVLAERQRATTLVGKLDTWEYYTSGKVARTERDSNGDAYVDQWWEYVSERTTECPLIHSDVDGDGRPDPGATVDVCRDQHVPEARDGTGPAASPLEDAVEAVPTEVDAPEPGSDSQATPAAEGGQP
jgi:hypothetical protein